jgi:hypothetical protein
VLGQYAEDSTATLSSQIDVSPVCSDKPANWQVKAAFAAIERRVSGMDSE